MPDSYNGVRVPAEGARITYKDGRIQVPSNPIIPFIEGDGTGRDIWKGALRGTRSSRARRPRPSLTTGCRRIQSKRFASFASPSKAR